MTRTRSTTFQGCAPVDADIDAEVFDRVVLAAVQDLNRLFDCVTGQNSPGLAPVVQQLTNDGSTNGGALLGIPGANMAPNAVVAAINDSLSTSGADVYLAVFPFFCAKGEFVWTFEVDTLDLGPSLTLEIYDGTGALIDTPADLEIVAGTGDVVGWRCFPQFAIDSARYFFALRASYDTAGDFKEIFSVRCYPSRVANPTGYIASQGADGATNIPVPLAAGGNFSAYETIHDEMIADNFAVPGWVITTLNHNINLLWEAILGAPVIGNSVTTNDDDGGATRPTASRFIAHTQAGADLANEKLVDFPLFCEALGAVRADAAAVVDNADPPTAGITGWFAPYIRSVGGTDCTVHRAQCWAPDFPAGGSSTLNMSVIGVHDPGKAGTPTNQSAKVIIGGNASAFVGFTRLGSTNFYIAEFSGLNFTADDTNLFELHVKTSSGAFTFGELAILGWAAWFTH